MHQPALGSRSTTRSRQRRRRILGLVAGASASVTLLFGTAASAAPPAPQAPISAPQRISGDRQSATVVDVAGRALHARDVYAFVGTDATERSYFGALAATANAVAVEFGIDPAVVRTAWTATDLEHQTAVLAALSELGTSYQSSTSSPGVGFDCSGLTAYAWSRAGFTLARQSSSQIDAARSVEHEAAVAGDIVRYPGHVMMYLGFGDAIVHAANHESDVELSNVPSGRSVRWGDPTG